MDSITEVVVMNVVMVYDMNTDSVLLQNRTRKWKGGCFPGGHLENGETVMNSAVREVKEETGLDVTDLVPCGFVHWNKSGGRHELIFCYRTSHFSGTLTQCDEGVNYWVKRTDLVSEPLAGWFRQQLPVFFGRSFAELSHIYDETTGGHPMTLHTQFPLPSADALPGFDSFPENSD